MTVVCGWGDDQFSNTLLQWGYKIILVNLMNYFDDNHNDNHNGFQ